MKFNRNLANRFVSDYKLPFPITFNEKLFKYYLKLFQKYGFNSQKLWDELTRMIKKYYNGDPEAFLQDYYDVRENIIQTVSTSHEYELFNRMNMDKFEIQNRPNVSSNSIFNSANIGKTFLSIDIKNANFQALKYINKGIVKYCQTYQQFIEMFCGHKSWLCEYIANSKYTRQVVFGKLNPKRHITIEKYMTNEIRKHFDYWVMLDKIEKNVKLVSMSNDELVYEVNITEDNKEIFSKIVKLNNLASIDVNIEIFKLEAYNLCYKKSGSISKTVYNKKHLVETSKPSKLKGVPQPFAPIIYKLYHGDKVCKKDRHFNYEGMDALINENFKIVKI